MQRAGLSRHSSLDVVDPYVVGVPPSNVRRWEETAWPERFLYGRGCVLGIRVDRLMVKHADGQGEGRGSFEVVASLRVQQLLDGLASPPLGPGAEEFVEVLRTALGAPFQRVDIDLPKPQRSRRSITDDDGTAGAVEIDDPEPDRRILLILLPDVVATGNVVQELVVLPVSEKGGAHDVYTVGSGTPARVNASRRSTQVPHLPQCSR